MTWQLLRSAILALVAGLTWSADVGASSPPNASQAISSVVAAPATPPASPRRETARQDERPSAHLLSGERPSLPRAELRQASLEMCLPLIGRSPGGVLFVCRPLASLALPPLPRPRLHVFLCTWLD